MDIFTLIYLILISIAGGYGAWWLYKAINSIAANIKDLQTNKYSQVTSSMDDIRTTISKSKGEIEAFISTREESIKSHITLNISDLRQWIMTQFSSHTNKLIENLETNRQTLLYLVNMVQNLHSQTSKGIKENSNKIAEINSSISYAISNSTSTVNTQISTSIKDLSLEEQQRERTITTGIDTIIKNIDKYNSIIEHHLNLLEESDVQNTKLLDNSITSLSSSLKFHTEEITSSCTQMIKSGKDFHDKTKESFDLLNINMSKYVTQIYEFDVMFNNLQRLYKNIIEEEKKISEQESSLSAMVSRHLQIVEITSEMNNTSKEILEFMKLYLIHSTLDNFKK